jgi:hypothetical protein
LTFLLFFVFFVFFMFFMFFITTLLTLFTLFTPVLLPFASVVKSTTTQRRGPHARSGVQHGH